MAEKYLFCKKIKFDHKSHGGSQSSSGPASAGPHSCTMTGTVPFGMTANRSSAASLTEELRKTLESSYLDGGYPGGPGGEDLRKSREKV